MMRNMHRKGASRLAALGVASALVLGLAAPAFAGERPLRKPEVKGPAEPLLTAIDSRGRLRQPTAAEAQELLAGLKAMSKSAEGVQVNHWPDGTMSMDLSGAFMHVWVAYVGQDGTIQNSCVDGPDAATALLTAAPAGEDK